MMIKVISIYLNDKEWGNETMLDAARQFARQWDGMPLLVTVHEHGGWWLQFWFDIGHDGTIVGTANDLWAPGPEQQSIRDRIMKSELETLPEIRR